MADYLSIMFLFDMGKESSIAEIGLAAGALIISRLLFAVIDIEEEMALVHIIEFMVNCIISGHPIT